MSSEVTKADPKPGDANWQEFILSQFEESEMWEGVPRMDGLRRMVEKYIGQITSTESKLNVVTGTQTPIFVCTVRVELSDGTSHEACSDASYYSVGDMFKNRLASIADNRAKAKAYREVLRLGNLSSSEELSGSSDLDEQELITASQISMISDLQSKIEVDANQVVKSLFDCGIGELKHSQAGTVIRTLGDWKAGRKDIPEEFLLVKKGKKAK